MGRKKMGMTPEALIAWSDALLGVSISESAAKLGLARSTVAEYRKRVKAFVSKKINIDEYRHPLYSLYPLWLSAVVKNLKAADVAMVIALGKGLGILTPEGKVSEPAPSITNIVNFAVDPERKESIRESLSEYFAKDRFRPLGSDNT